MNRSLLHDDRAENSIMQTITIAVSAILIAAGLVTAPGLINNARDNNATGDLSNIAYSEEGYLGDTGKYTANIQSDASGEDALDGHVTENGTVLTHYTTSDKVTLSAVVCKGNEQGYLLRAISSSSHVFYRSSESSNTSSDLAQITLSACLTPEDLISIGVTAPPGGDYANDLLGTTSYASGLGHNDPNEGGFAGSSLDVANVLKKANFANTNTVVYDDPINATLVGNDYSDTPIEFYVGSKSVSKYNGTVSLFSYVGTGPNAGKASGVYGFIDPQIDSISDWSGLFSGNGSAHITIQGKSIVIKIPAYMYDINDFDATGYTDSGADLSTRDSGSAVFASDSGKYSIAALIDTDQLNSTAFAYYNKAAGGAAFQTKVHDAQLQYKAPGESTYSTVATIEGRVGFDGIQLANNDVVAGPYFASAEPFDLPAGNYNGGTWRIKCSFYGADYTITGGIGFNG
jgi:hypothetical protein